MPKCLDCDNTTRFWFEETSHKLGIYTADGTFDDVEDDYYDEPVNGTCATCDSKNVEGKL